jgi:hypothetical protein
MLYGSLLSKTNNLRVVSLDFLGPSKVSGMSIRFLVDGRPLTGLFFGALRRGRIDGAGRIEVAGATEAEASDNDILFGVFTRGAFSKSVKTFAL